ncbi:MAG: hypothetical protein OEY52_14925 [Gammaproteobacteria bacterium]|nr:hypothetical protein [Gammaproteobacteria bacterium]
MNISILLVISLIILSGCGSGDTNNTQPSTPLLGVWVTESCEQISDKNEVPQNIWFKGLYEFTDQGKILLGAEQYSDSNCITHSKTRTPAEVNVPITYQDHGPQTLQEGINGGGLLIEIGEGDQLISTDAFYTIQNNSLCFSDAFTFEALKFSNSGPGTEAIDFDNCLVRP